MVEDDGVPSGPSRRPRQVARRHRKFLSFAFGGKAYQYKVLPFGLGLAPRRLQGSRILNYLDVWLILAHSRDLVSYHRDVLLHRILFLGLRKNSKRDVLTPSHLTVSWGFTWIMFRCRPFFKLGYHVSVSTCCRLLGLMATNSTVLLLGLLLMGSFLWWMKHLGIRLTGPVAFASFQYDGIPSFFREGSV